MLKVILYLEHVGWTALFSDNRLVRRNYANYGMAQLLLVCFKRPRMAWAIHVDTIDTNGELYSTIYTTYEV